MNYKINKILTISSNLKQMNNKIEHLLIYLKILCWWPVVRICHDSNACISDGSILGICANMILFLWNKLDMPVIRGVTKCLK